jgi:hypothetical protein
MTDAIPSRMMVAGAWPDAAGLGGAIAQFAS